jgi:putative heme-binding domain-containing protein
MRRPAADLPIGTLQKLLATSDADLRREALWAMILSDDPQRFTSLAHFAADTSNPAERRADAVLGLAYDLPKQSGTLQKLAESADAVVRTEAKRNLTRTPSTERRPAVEDVDAWEKRTARPGDADAGRRVFFRPGAARCASCHAVEGRGATVGPDLTLIAKGATRRRLLESILQPGLEVAPQYQSWVVETHDGRVRTGMSLGKHNDDRTERFLGADGKTFDVNTRDVASMRASPTSIMPNGLEQQLSVDELRDLLAYLMSRR